MLPSILLSSSLVALASALTPQIRKLDQLPKGTWLENAAVRPVTGELLVTQLAPDANIWIVDNPSQEGSSPMKLLTTLPKGNAAIGITQVKDTDGKETYVIIGGFFPPGKGQPTAGSFTAYSLKFPSRKTDDFQLKKIAFLGKDIGGPNGIASSKDYPGIVMIADSVSGYIGRLNITSGHYEPSLWADATTKAPGNGTTGANGIKIRGSDVYWTNSDAVSVYKAPMTRSGYPVPNTVPKLVANMSSVASIVDDFIFDYNGNIYAATNLDNDIIYVDTKTGRSKIVAGGLTDFTLEGIGALALGPKTAAGETLLYGVTSGGLERPINNITEGAKVVTVKLDACQLQ